MVWFSEETVSVDMMYYHYLERLKQEDYNSLIKEGSGDESKEDQKDKAPSTSFEDTSKLIKKTREV